MHRHRFLIFFSSRCSLCIWLTKGKLIVKSPFQSPLSAISQHPFCSLFAAFPAFCHSLPSQPALLLHSPSSSSPLFGACILRAPPPTESSPQYPQLSPATQYQSTQTPSRCFHWLTRNVTRLVCRSVTSGN